jgi:drug/metabolite transporter (DMT)-like permease
VAISLLVRRATGMGNRFVAVTLRALPAFLITLTVVLATPQRRAQLISGTENFIGWKSIVAIAVQALLIFSIGNSLQFESLKWGGVTITTPINSTSAIFGGLLAFFILREIFNREMLGGMLITSVGVYALTRGQAMGVPVSEHWQRAVLFSLLGAFGSSVGGILLTAALRRGTDVFVAMLLSTGIAVLSMVIVLGLQGELSLYWTSPPSVVRDLLLAGVINAVSVLAITQALALSPWAIVTSISRLSVVLAPLAAVLFLDESINLLMVLGILLVVGGVILVQWGQARGRRQGASVQPDP